MLVLTGALEKSKNLRSSLEASIFSGWNRADFFSSRTYSPRGWEEPASSCDYIVAVFCSCDKPGDNQLEVVEIYEWLKASILPSMKKVDTVFVVLQEYLEDGKINRAKWVCSGKYTFVSCMHMYIYLLQWLLQPNMLGIQSSNHIECGGVNKSVQKWKYIFQYLVKDKTNRLGLKYDAKEHV